MLTVIAKGSRSCLCGLMSVNQRRLVGEVASIARRIFDAATTGSRRTSLSQTRTTVQPTVRRTRATCRSRWRFRSTFATPHGAFQPSASLPGGSGYQPALSAASSAFHSSPPPTPPLKGGEWWEERGRSSGTSMGVSWDMRVVT